MSSILSLAIFSGLSLNLVLQLGLGIRELNAAPDKNLGYFLYRCAAIFAAVILLWLFFTYVLSPLSLGSLEYFLLFPLTVLVYTALEALSVRFFPRITPKEGVSASYNGLTMAAEMLTLSLAASFGEAVVLSLGFSLGALGSALFVKEIHRRSSMEAIPAVLRGMPLMLISMGLLSLIFSSVAGILLKALGVF